MQKTQYKILMERRSAGKKFALNFLTAAETEQDEDAILIQDLVVAQETTADTPGRQASRQDAAFMSAQRTGNTALQRKQSMRSRSTTSQSESGIFSSIARMQSFLI